jgi:hypothetical protein
VSSADAVAVVRCDGQRFVEKTVETLNIKSLMIFHGDHMEPQLQNSTYFGEYTLELVTVVYNSNDTNTYLQ